MLVIPRLSRRQLLTLALLAALAIAATAWLVARSLSPSPPRSVTMTTGAPDGAYAQFALKYRQFFAANGVRLVLQSSSGSVQNLERLRGRQGDASIGLLQGGLGPLTLDSVPADDSDEGLRTLVVVGYEPIWIFSTQIDLSNGLGALAGKRVGVGLAGSGNQKLALDLLKAYGIGPAQASLVTESTTRAAQMLVDKQLDALIFIAAAQAPAVTRLLHSPGVVLAALGQVEGLARRFPYLQPVVLHRGSVDFAHDLPARDIALLATTTQIVVRDDLHPALAYLLLEAARHTHRGPSLFNRPGEFPNLRGADFAVADEAERYFTSGRPFLQRYLPFWVANFVQRLIVLLVPLLALAVPVFKMLPALLSWKQKNRLFLRYGELQYLERDIASRKLSQADAVAAHRRLDQIEAEARTAHFALDMADRVYTLRQHVDYVRGRLAQYAAPDPAAPDPPHKEPLA